MVSRSALKSAQMSALTSSMISSMLLVAWTLFVTAWSCFWNARRTSTIGDVILGTIEAGEHVAHLRQRHVDRAGKPVVLVFRGIAHVQPQRPAAHLVPGFVQPDSPQQRLAQQVVELLLLQP